jgi:glycerol-1-phosphate dehydrogenase [NAD(P)+]
VSPPINESQKPEAVELPTRLEDLLEFASPCSCGRTHSVSTRGAVIRPGALDELPDWVRQVGARLRIAIVVDRRTHQIAGERVVDLLRADGCTTLICELPDGAGGRPHADDEQLERVHAALAQVDLAVAVGSGTINDLTKLASFRREIPYLVAATAPSMNGYTSGIAAVMLGGVKCTVDCHQPLAVLADLDVICKAPAELTAAGIGDLESNPTATADYRLAGRLRGDFYCSAPEGVVLSAEARVAEAAEAIAAGDPAAMALLTEALLLSGFSMKLAGSSSPASGGEHLISHHWDMTAESEGRVEGWHGAQVGVATIVTAALYEHLAQVDPADIDPDALVSARPAEADLKRQIASLHGPLAELVEPEVFDKRLPNEQLHKQLEGIRAGWSELWAHLSPVLRPAARIREILRAARAPTTVAELGLSPDHLRRSLQVARDIRSRYTVLDFAAELGLLGQSADQVLARSGCLG